jgi:hypothetical protein
LWPASPCPQVMDGGTAGDPGFGDARGHYLAFPEGMIYVRIQGSPHRGMQPAYLIDRSTHDVEGMAPDLRLARAKCDPQCKRIYVVCLIYNHARRRDHCRTGPDAMDFFKYHDCQRKGPLRHLTPAADRPIVARNDQAIQNLETPIRRQEPTQEDACIALRNMWRRNSGGRSLAHRTRGGIMAE